MSLALSQAALLTPTNGRFFIGENPRTRAEHLRNNCLKLSDDL